SISNAKKDQTIYKKIQWIMSQNRKQAGGSRAKGFFEDSCGVTRFTTPVLKKPLRPGSPCLVAVF
ncbi:hypothetical protein ACVGXP_00065, partial [Enterobacter hormaechei]